MFYDAGLKHIGHTDVKVAVVNLILGTMLRHIDQAPIITEVEAIVVKHRNARTQTQAEIEAFEILITEGVGLTGNATHCITLSAEQSNSYVGSKRAIEAQILADWHTIADVDRHLEIVGTRGKAHGGLVYYGLDFSAAR